MALFSKEPEHNASPGVFPRTTALACLTGNTFTRRENVASARDATTNLREASAALRKPVETRAYLDSRTKINGQLTFEGPAQIDGQIEGEIVAPELSRDRSRCLGDGQDQGGFGRSGGNGQRRNHRHRTD